MTPEQEKRDRVNALYREEGWGKVAEYFGHEPYDVESQARVAYAEMYEALADHMKLFPLREAIIGKRRREVLVSGGLVGVEEIKAMRANMIQLRDGALEMGAMEWALMLSHVIHVLLIMTYIFDGDPVTLLDKQTYTEVPA